MNKKTVISIILCVIVSSSLLGALYILYRSKDFFGSFITILLVLLVFVLLFLVIFFTVTSIRDFSPHEIDEDLDEDHLDRQIQKAAHTIQMKSILDAQQHSKPLSPFKRKNKLDKQIVENSVGTNSVFEKEMFEDTNTDINPYPAEVAPSLDVDNAEPLEQQKTSNKNTHLFKKEEPIEQLPVDVQKNDSNKQTAYIASSAENLQFQDTQTADIEDLTKQTVDAYLQASEDTLTNLRIAKINNQKRARQLESKYLAPKKPAPKKTRRNFNSDDEIVDQILNQILDLKPESNNATKNIDKQIPVKLNDTAIQQQKTQNKYLQTEIQNQIQKVSDTLQISTKEINKALKAKKTAEKAKKGTKKK